MNKSQIIHLIEKGIRSNHLTNPNDELKIVLQLLSENPLKNEYPAINDIIQLLRGIISHQNEKLNQRTEKLFETVYEN